MEGIKFLFLAFLTTILSIKLSVYADEMDKKTKLGGLLIGGLLLASITSFPEFVTALSSVFIHNPNLALGDVLGSNVFNILIISILDLLFIKYMFMNKISKKYSYLIISLLSIYIVLLALFHDFFQEISHISIVSCYIFFVYIIFVILLSKIKINDRSVESNTNIKNIYLKFILTTMGMILLSVCLTIQANKIAIMNPLFSSSTIGAFLLGTTTSLPEVVTTFALVRIGSYRLGFSNIIGSNAFNFLILAICDLFIKGRSVYSFKDDDAILFLTFGFYMHIILLMSLLFNKNRYFKYMYIIPSLLLVIIYIYIFYLQFS